MRTADGTIERYPTTVAGFVLAGAVAAALVGGPVAKLGVGALVAVVTVLAARLLRRAWRDRVTAGIAALLLTVPLAGLVLALLVADAPRIERWSAAVDVTVTTSFAAAAVLVFVGAQRLLLSRRRRDGTPWASLSAASGAVRRANRAGWTSLTAGVALVVAGLLLAAVAPRGLSGLGGDWPGLVLLTILAIAALLVAPALAAAVAAGRFDRMARERAMQRQAVAAHLHDSVLQTFALVQRRLGEPEEARRLIRRQERELRDWLAGRDALRADSLAGALQQVADEVEAELHVPIELETLGDRPLTSTVGLMVDAAREGLRNAARHGGEAPIRVLAVVDGGTTEIYIRDAGPGFVLDAVPTARRGIRDAIIGRMEAVGGSAVIDAAPGAGTEVVLRLPGRTGGER